MPAHGYVTREWLCEKHGEVMVECKMSDKDLPCPKCKKPMRALISRSDVYGIEGMRPAVFKGTYHWHFKTQPRWKEESPRIGSADPVAVGAYKRHYRSKEDLLGGKDNQGQPLK